MKCFRKHAKLHDTLEAPDAKRKSEDIQSFVSHPLSVTEKGELATMFAQYAINGDASFRSMSMPAFNKLATTLINFGVRRKKQVQDAQLVDRRTIARHATALADNTFKELAVRSFETVLFEEGGKNMWNKSNLV